MVQLEWLIPEKVLLLRMSGSVTLDEIAALVPDLQRRTAPVGKVDVLHDLTDLEHIQLQWRRLPRLINELRKLKVDRAIYVRNKPRPILERLARLLGQIFGIRVHMLHSMERAYSILKNEPV